MVFLIGNHPTKRSLEITLGAKWHWLALAALFGYNARNTL